MVCNETREHLSAYLDKELSAELSAAVRAHLAACPECRALADELRATATLLGRLPVRPAPEHVAADIQREIERRLLLEEAPPALDAQPPERTLPLHRARAWPRVAAVAATALLAAGISVMAYLGRQGAVPQGVTVAEKSAPQTPPVAVATNARPGDGKATYEDRSAKNDPASAADPSALADGYWKMQKAPYSGDTAVSNRREEFHEYDETFDSNPKLSPGKDVAGKFTVGGRLTEGKLPDAGPVLDDLAAAHTRPAGEFETRGKIAFYENADKTSKQADVVDSLRKTATPRTRPSGDPTLPLTDLNSYTGATTPSGGIVLDRPAALPGSNLKFSTDLGWIPGTAQQADALGHSGFSGGFVLAPKDGPEADARLARADQKSKAGGSAREADKTKTANSGEQISSGAGVLAMRSTGQATGALGIAGGAIMMGNGTLDASTKKDGGENVLTKTGIGTVTAKGSDPPTVASPGGYAVVVAPAAPAPAPPASTRPSGGGEKPAAPAIIAKGGGTILDAPDEVGSAAEKPQGWKGSPPAATPAEPAALETFNRLRDELAQLAAGRGAGSLLRVAATDDTLSNVDNQLVLQVASADEGAKNLQKLFAENGWRAAATATGSGEMHGSLTQAGTGLVPDAESARPAKGGPAKELPASGIYYLTSNGNEPTWLVLADRDSLSQFASRLAQLPALAVSPGTSRQFQAVADLQKAAQEGLMAQSEKSPARPPTKTVGAEKKVSETAKVSAPTPPARVPSAVEAPWSTPPAPLAVLPNGNGGSKVAAPKVAPAETLRPKVGVPTGTSKADSGEGKLEIPRGAAPEPRPAAKTEILQAEPLSQQPREDRSVIAQASVSPVRGEQVLLVIRVMAATPPAAALPPEARHTAPAADAIHGD
jgi:anti-sigma factor RsiW